jgi:predicted metalloprotease
MHKVPTLLAVSFVLTACESPGSASAPADAALALYNAAKEEAEAFWEQVYRQKGLEYRPVSVFTPYSAPIAVPCGNTVLWDVRYCPQNEGIYFHLDLLGELQREAGAAAAVLVVAHEVGHHVSNLRGLYIALDARFITLKELELQADCYSGAWAAWAASGPLLQGSDPEGSARELMALADERTDLRWLNAALHGAAEQRVNAFLLGLNGGSSACEDIFSLR